MREICGQIIINWFLFPEIDSDGRNIEIRNTFEELIIYLEEKLSTLIRILLLLNLHLVVNNWNRDYIWPI